MGVSRQRGLLVLLLSICFVATILFIALEVNQDEFYLLFGLITGAFGALFGIYWMSSDGSQVTWLIGLAILLRVCLIWVDPGLSDDIYRFVWDGMLWHDGINPFAYTPSQLFQSQSLSSAYQGLYPLLNSQDYYTIYPPVCQLIFWLSTFDSLPSWLFGAPLIKIIFLISEITTLYIMSVILQRFEIPRRTILLYALNPLILIEFGCNLHFEALMICFLLMMICFLLQDRLVYSGVAYGLAVASKILPLMFGPFILMYLGYKRGIRFFIPAGIVVLGSFGLMLQGHLSSLLSSTDLYFQSFEFNASIYYLVRWVLASIVGFNPIGFVGPLLSIMSVVYILLVSWSVRGASGLRQVHLQVLLIIFSLYLCFATTVHPWYISTLVALSILSGLRYPIVWSYVVFLSYSAYLSTPVVENQILIALQYLIVAGCLWYEYRSGKLSALLRILNPHM